MSQPIAALATPQECWCWTETGSARGWKLQQENSNLTCRWSWRQKTWRSCNEQLHWHVQHFCHVTETRKTNTSCDWFMAKSQTELALINNIIDYFQVSSFTFKCCNSDLCNSAPSSAASSVIGLLALVAVMWWCIHWRVNSDAAL